MRREKTSREQKLHKAAIDKIVADWMDGKITVDEKRQRIHEENTFFHGVPMAPARELVPAVSHYRPDPDEREPWWQR